MQIRDRRQQAAITQSNQQNSVPMGLQNQNQMQQMGINSVQRPPVMNQQQQLVNASHPQPGRQQTFFQTPEGRQIPGPPLRDDINTLSPKDYQQVCQLAEQIAQKTSPADLEKIKQNLQNMTSEQRLLLERKGLTPLEYFFRCQALKNIRKFKSAAHMNMASPQPLNVNPANPSELMAAHQRQMNQPPMQFQGTPTMPMAGLEATFGGGFDQLHGQQMDPHRSQAPGHPAIPAPNPSMMNQMSFNPQHNPFQGGQPNMLAQQQHRQNLQNAQQEKMQQAAHFQAQSDAQARAQAAAKAQRAISSQATPMVPQTMPQQSPINPMLNQPISHMQIPPGGMTPQNRQFSRPPGMGQNPNVMQTPRPALPPGIPPGLQNQLAQLPPDQANAMLQNYRRAANNPAMLRQNPALSVQHQLQDPAQVRQGPGANMAVDPNMRGPVGMSHPMANMGGMPPQPGMQSQQFTVQKPGQQPMGFQQQPDPRFQYAQPRNNLNFTMNEDQIREMDRAALPNALLTSNPTLAQVLPKSLRTWGQLKMWASKNPQGLGDVSMEKLAMLQKVHFSQILQARREAANRGMAQPGQVPMGTDQNGFRQPPFNPQGPTQLPQQFPGQPPVPMPVMRPVTATDVQLARQKIGAPVEKLSDDALRSLLEKNRHKHYIAHMTRARDAGQPFTQIPNQVPAPGQVPAPLQQQQFPASQPPAPISQPGPTPGMPAKNMVLGPQTGASAARAPIMKEPQKSLKRPSDSEPEVPVSLSQPQISPSQTIPTQPSRPTPPQPTPEQLAAMNPQQRAQWEAHMRRQQQGPPRQTITKAAAEAAWSRMPDHLKQMYEEIAIKDRASPTYPAAMTSAESAAFAQQLRENTDMLSRMDALVQFYAKMVGQDQMIQRLLQMVC